MSRKSRRHERGYHQIARQWGITWNKFVWILIITAITAINLTLNYETDSYFINFLVYFFIVFVAVVFVYGIFIGKIPILERTNGRSYSSSSESDEDASIDYLPQRLSVNGWLNLGHSFHNLDAAVSSIESSRRYHPNDKFRVAERRNGKIVGTAYSC